MNIIIKILGTLLKTIKSINKIFLTSAFYETNFSIHDNEQF